MRLQNHLKSKLVLLAATVLLIAGCSTTAAPHQAESPAPSPPATSAKQETNEQPTQQPAAQTNTVVAEPVKKKPADTKKPMQEETKPSNQPDSASSFPPLEVVAEPASMTVLVNKQHQLPEKYQPNDLTFPNVPFLLPEKSEKRKMRKAAAEALEQLFAAAKADGIALAGVSAYRSHAYQQALFNRYVKQDGEAKARTYSAVPGTSEHETGLAIDVSGIDGKCAATSCFAGTKEAEWLALHAAEYGFIIRYPEGKDAVTGYMYEPWHLRYVGTDISKEIADKSITLEEYFGAVPAASSQN